MRLARIGSLGAEKPAVLVTDTTYVDVSDVVHDFDEAFFAGGGVSRLAAVVAERAASADVHTIADRRVGSPIARPHQILCIGLNYSDHAAETGQPVPDEPILFTKSPNTMVGPFDDVVIPRGSLKTDWEVELGIVIGKRCRYLADEREARDAIAGYVLVNDVSERAFQMEHGGQWCKGKSAETFNPCGPRLATPDEFADVEDLDMWLDVNDQRMQTGSTSTMIFGPAFLVHYLSQFMVLEPGDLINTGTPPGVGLGQKPPRFLAAGDTMARALRVWVASDRPSSRRPEAGLMKAFVVTGPREAAVLDVPDPVVEPGHVVVDVSRVGVCGTDVEFYKGDMAYLHNGSAKYPLRLGHEWCGTVSEVGEGVDAWWLGQRVTGDTMLGCGHCHRCVSGRQHVCADRYEIGVRHGWPGALAGRLPVPVTALHALPDTIDDTAGALIEPGANALRAVLAAGAEPGRRILVWGSGTIGLLATQLAVAHGADVHVVGHHEETPAMARAFGATKATHSDEGVEGIYDSIIDASNSTTVPAQALDTVEPGGRLVYIGLASQPSLVDTRSIVLADVTAVGILSGSPAMQGVIEHFASGRVDPRPVVAATVALEQTAWVLSGGRPDDAGPGPKVHIDPRIVES